MENIYKIPAEILTDEACEFMETILHSDSRLYIERIISHGHTTEHGKWYDQDHDEWVVVLKGWARIQYKNGREIQIDEGDHLFLPKRVAHRVSLTSSPCVWLAVHGATLGLDCRSSADLKK